MSDTDLVYMFNVSPDLQNVNPFGEFQGYDDPPMVQDPVTTGASTVVEPGASKDIDTVASRPIAANDDMSPFLTATSHVVSRESTNGTSSSLPVDSPSSPTNVRCAIKPTEKRNTRTSHRRRLSNALPEQRRARSTLQQASLSSTLYPTDKSTPGVRDLFGRLSREDGATAPMLVYVFAEIIALTTFPRFKNALQFFSSHKKIRLPRHSRGLLPLMDVLEQIEGSQSSLYLCRSMGLLRMRDHYIKSERTIAVDSANPASDGLRKKVGGRVAARTYDLLVREACLSNTLEEKRKTRKRIRNHVAAGRVWSILCDTIGMGVLALIPKVAPSTLERVSSSAIRVFIQFLHENAGPEILSLIGLLSDHLPAILEGDACNLASAITRGTAENWHQLLVLSPELAPCHHPATRQ